MCYILGVNFCRLVAPECMAAPHRAGLLHGAMKRRGMKGFKIFKIAIMTCLVMINWCSPGAAFQPGDPFHTGSSDECLECHIADKNSSLRASDASSTCLRCHQAPVGTMTPTGSYIATNTENIKAGALPSQLTPGGDFSYLKVTYSWIVFRQPTSSAGERHGHNIVAIDYGYEADRTQSKAPSGTYPSDRLSCTSCHNPHGKIVKDPAVASAYRMLGGIGYKTSLVPGMAFTFDPPVAVAPRDYNRSEALTNTRVAYGKGMGEWCTNCHTTTQTGKGHHAGARAFFTPQIMFNYNSYVKSGEINGMSETSYTSLVPFEEGIDDRIILAQHAKTDDSYLQGPDSNSTVMCLTCHRAHASGWDSGLRWNMSSTFVVYKGIYPGTDNGSPTRYAQGRTAAQTQRALYDRPSSRFAGQQRVLCNKCHERD
jgi:hypothetical protein